MDLLVRTNLTLKSFHRVVHLILHTGGRQPLGSNLSRRLSSGCLTKYSVNLNGVLSAVETCWSDEAHTHFILSDTYSDEAHTYFILSDTYSDEAHTYFILSDTYSDEAHTHFILSDTYSRERTLLMEFHLKN